MTLGELRMTLGELRMTLGELRMTLGELRMTLLTQSELQCLQSQNDRADTELIL